MKIFENKAQLALARLQTGQLVRTKGGASEGDGNGSTYHIVGPSGTGVTIANGNVAENIGNVEFGLRGQFAAASIQDMVDGKVLGWQDSADDIPFLTGQMWTSGFTSWRHNGGVAGTLADFDAKDAINAYDFGALGDNLDYTTELQTAIDAAVGKVLVIPDGTYLLSATLVIPSDSDIRLSSNAILKRNAAYDPMVLNGEVGGSYPARSAGSRIRFTGGILDCVGQTYGNGNGIVFAQGEDVITDSVTFRNCQNVHFIEYAAILRGRVSNCIFDTMIDTGGREFSEAIQLDGLFSPVSFPHFGGASFDNTPCESIEMLNNTFYDCLTAIGSHGWATYSDGTITTAHKSINVLGVNAVNCAWDAVRLDGWFNVNVNNVNITTCGNNGIKVEDSRNFNINNITVSTASGNAVFAATLTASFSVQDANISNITMRTGSDGVNLFKADNLNISNVRIFNARHGVQFAACNDVVLGNINAETSVSLITCSLTEVASNRISGTSLHGRSLSGNGMVLKMTDSTLWGGVVSVPAAGFSNVVFQDCGNAAVGGMFFNGANVAQTVSLDGSTNCVVDSCRNAGTGVAGVVITATCDRTVLQNLRLNGPTTVTDGGTNTVQVNVI